MTTSFTYSGFPNLNVTPGSPPNTDPHSIAGWFYPTSTADFGESAEINTSSGGISVIGIKDASAEINWRLSNSTFSAFVDLSSNVNLNEWHHVCCTYDGTTARLYVDGAQVTTSTPGYGTRSGTWGVCQVGPTNATMSDVVFYSAAIGAADVANLAKYRNPRRRANLEMQYPLFAGSSMRLVDFSGKGRNLTASGSVSDGTVQPPAGWGGDAANLILAGNAVALGAVTCDTTTALTVAAMLRNRGQGALTSATASSVIISLLDRLVALGTMTQATASALLIGHLSAAFTFDSMQADATTALNAARISRALAMGAIDAATATTLTFAALSGGTSTPNAPALGGVQRRYHFGRRRIR